MANRERMHIYFKNKHIDQQVFIDNLYDDLEKCEVFFNKLVDLLSDDYVLVGSCNQDNSAYLVPKGTEEEISWYGKPEWSFRISEHWNWYANLKKCEDETFVQCESLQLPRARFRRKEGYASIPIYASQVCVYYNGKYHCIYGRYRDHYNKKRNGTNWPWMENDPEAIAESYKSEKLEVANA